MADFRAVSTERLPKNKGKRKFDDAFDNIFTKVMDKNENRNVRKQLEAATLCLENGLNHLLVREIKVIDANANRAVPFSRASIGMDKYDNIYALGTIFTRGHAVLSRYLQSDVSKGEMFVPEDPTYRKALEMLLKFIDAHHDKEAEILTCKDVVEEWHWTLELAQHVFSKLAINPNYKYDISRNYDEALGCPCPVHESLDGEKGDTSFGCEKGWHGKVDVLMADVPICPVVCETDFTRPFSHIPSSSVSETSETDSCISIEEKRNKFNDNDYSQIVSETITYSFLKNKGKSGKEVTLIPSIAINKAGVQCFFYDSFNDVLLQSGYVELILSKSRINVNGIVLIWLTLNHQLFCTGSLPAMEKAGFHKLVDMNMYKEEVKAPCEISQDSEQMCISDISWSNRTDSVRMRDVSLSESIHVPVINLMQKGKK